MISILKIRTWEPGPVLGNLDLHRTLVGDPYSGTWTRTWELDPYSFMYSNFRTRTRLCTQIYCWPNISDSYGMWDLDIKAWFFLDIMDKRESQYQNRCWLIGSNAPKFICPNCLPKLKSFWFRLKWLYWVSVVLGHERYRLGVNQPEYIHCKCFDCNVK